MHREHGVGGGSRASGAVLRGGEVGCLSGTRRDKRHPKNGDWSVVLEAHVIFFALKMDREAVPRRSVLL